ncbi:NADP-dependent oxidoreductase [Saccharopolyspora rhizosphaerae]|uniref:NADP-dependent oxidoreductase n=1 Tax=Saccharopolyspora rhizosphaerae TaxID=2492662 RepID=A0A426K544_9PSEU|nr:NADP-dependent oxidoreductase [Saccharopolyspora rhizosphaerae]RRO20521.1 NADP-dependent oxidoreductase [Saccharopolyspora rhizosphaerae]
MREVRLAAHPQDTAALEHFDVVETTTPEPQDGQILVRNLWMSVDPCMRAQMNRGVANLPGFQVGEPLHRGAIGAVIDSRTDDQEKGDVVLHRKGWRTHAVLDAHHATKVDAHAVPPQAYLGVLGTTGFTAYLGLARETGVPPGETVFLSGAAGAVGSTAGQLARHLGAGRVIGSTGDPDKARWLTDELGFDAAINYREGPVSEQLAEAAPEGIDLFFDNVGGEHLEAALGAMNYRGRIALCGQISTYDTGEPPTGPRNLVEASLRCISIHGFQITSSEQRALVPEFIAEVAPMVASGALKHRETVYDGLHQAPEALLGLFTGKNTGKMLVRL